MKAIIYLVLASILCSCSSINLDESRETDRTNEKLIIGTWKYFSSKPAVDIYVTYYKNGKKVTTGIVGETLYAYEAKWRIENGYLFENITRILYDPKSHKDTKRKTKNKILSLSYSKLRHEIDGGEHIKEMTYYRVLGI